MTINIAIMTMKAIGFGLMYFIQRLFQAFLSVFLVLSRKLIFESLINNDFVDFFTAFRVLASTNGIEREVFSSLLKLCLSFFSGEDTKIGLSVVFSLALVRSTQTAPR